MSTEKQQLLPRIYRLLFEHDSRDRKSIQRLNGFEYENLENRQLLATLSAGELDPRFGDLGLRPHYHTYLDDDYDQVTDVAEQADGKLVAGGNNLIARYNTDGTLDQSFGSGGWIQIPEIVEDGDSTEIEILPDGRILVAGAEENTRNLLVTMLNSDGSRDTGFGVDGIARQELLAFQAGAETYFGVSDLDIDSSGRILVSATTGGNFSGNYFNNADFVRFSSDGSIDTSFGSGGHLQIEVDSYSKETLIQPDGKILRGMKISGGTGNLVRFDSNGSLDTTFGNGGEVDVDISVADMAFTGTGQIVVAGYYFDSLRLNTDGTQDLTYGVDGFAYADLSNVFNSAYSSGLSIASSGQILITGDGRLGNGDGGGEDVDIVVTSFNADGTIDTGFDGDGILQLVSPTTVEYADGVYHGASGANYAFGLTRFNTRGPLPTEDSSSDFAIARFDSSGTLDSTFGVGGVVSQGFLAEHRGYGSAQAVVAQPDGKFVTLGQTQTTFGPAYVLNRFNADGSLDNSFGVNGKAVFDLGDINASGYEMDLIIQPDGKFVIASSAMGTFANGDNDSRFVAIRANTDGSLDTTFGGTGWIEVELPGDNIYATSVAHQADGKILLGGYTYSSLGRYMIARVDASGVLDTSFSGDGMAFFTGYSGTVNDIAVQGDKVIVTGGNNGDGAVTLRLNSDGSPDSTFGNNGRAYTNQTSSYDRFESLAIQPDNRIVVAGTSSNAIVIERYNANGTLDTSFGTNGAVDVAIGNYGEANGVEVQPDGKILVAGHSETKFLVVRLNSNGTIDNSFSSDGLAWVNFESTRQNERANDVTMLPDGGIIAVGQLDPGQAIVKLLSSPMIIGPVAVNDQFEISESDSLTGSVFSDNQFGMDYDYLGNQFSVTMVNGLASNVGQSIALASGALLTLNSNGSFVYDTNGQFDAFNDADSFLETFTYRISTDAVSHDTALVSIDIEGYTELRAVRDQYLLPWNTRLNDDASGNDTVSVHAGAFYEIFNGPANGTVAMNGDGTFSYRPDPGFIGMDRFVYKVGDGFTEDYAGVDIEVGDQRLIDDLVAYWNFDGTTGTAFDVAPNDVTGDNANLLHDAVNTPHGFLNDGVSLDGMNDVVQVPTSFEINGSVVTERTISLWFYANELPLDGSKQVLFESGAQSGFNIYLQDGELYVGAWRNYGAGWQTFLNTEVGDVQANDWHQVTLVLDSPYHGTGTLTAYLDGQEFATGLGERINAHRAGTGIGGMYGGTAFHDIGRVNRHGYSFNGTIDEVRIHNRALSPAEISASMAANLRDGLTANWDADAIAGPVLYDVSPEGQDNSALLAGAQIVPGQNGNAISFDGDDYVDVSNSQDINQARFNQRTISLNFNPTTIDGGRQVLFEQGYKSGLNIYIENGELVVGGFRNGGVGWQQFYRTSAIEAGTWHQVTIVLDAPSTGDGTFEAYLDGNQFGSGVGQWIGGVRSKIGLGQMRGGSYFDSGTESGDGYFYNGLMDDIRIYDRAFDLSEIQALFDRR